MKSKHLKIFWQTAQRFWLVGFCIWIIETSIFLIIEGWHIKATHPVEIWLDKLVSGMWSFALWLTLYVVINYLINLSRKQ